MDSISATDTRPGLDYCLTHSVIAGAEEFPFAVTTAAGRNPQYEEQNGQDAVGICVTPHFAVGIVCDGCAGTHEEYERHSSSGNEVGAKLACSRVLRCLQTSFLRKRVFRPEELVLRIERAILTAFKSTVKAFCGRDEDAAERFIFDFLMTTVVGFAVTDEQFIVFHCGDGIIGINGEFTNLNVAAGRYLSNRLLTACCPSRFDAPDSSNSIQLFASGHAKDLQSIFVASDGMYGLTKAHATEMRAFVQRAPGPNQCEKGFDFALQEFRRDIAWNAHVQFHPDDDLSFAMLRRIATT